MIGEHGPVISNADDMVSKKHVNIVALLIACRIAPITLGCKSVAVKCLMLCAVSLWGVLAVAVSRVSE